MTGSRRRIGLGSEGNGGGTVLRHGVRPEARYAFATSLDRRASWIAAATSVLATLIVLSAL